VIPAPTREKERTAGSGKHGLSGPNLPCGRIMMFAGRRLYGAESFATPLTV
jgi:hypothetical protein